MNTLRLTAYALTDNPQQLVRSIIGHVAAGDPKIEFVGEQEEIDFNYMLAKGSANSMAIRVEGSSMEGDIESGDWVVVAFDRVPQPGDIVIARITGGYTIKRLKLNDLKGKRGLFLVASNGQFPTRELASGDEFTILGVVTGKVHSFV